MPVALGDRSRLVFGDFLHQLSRVGFVIGVDQHLRLQRLLELAGDSCTPADLKTLLCPLFATSERQQKLFCATFDVWYPQFRDPDAPPAPVFPPPHEEQGGSPETLGFRRWPYLLAAACFVIAVFFASYFSRHRGSAPNVQLPVAGVVKPIYSWFPKAALPGQAGNAVHPPALDNRFVDKVYERYSIPIWWTLMVSPSVFWLAFEWYRFTRRKLFMRQQKGKKPPYDWAIRLPSEKLPFLDNSEFYGLVRQLLRRQAAETVELDVTATVDATVGALGYQPTVVDGKPVEVMTEIDLTCPKRIAMIRESGVPPASRQGSPGGVLGGIIGSVPSAAPPGAPPAGQWGDPLAKLGPPSNGPGSGGGIGSGQGGEVGSGSAGGVFRVGGRATAPVLISKVEPEYSEEARKAALEGTVLLYVEVGPEGKATNIKVVRSVGMGLDEKAIEAVRQWKFRSGYKDGQPVTVAATIEVNFRLTVDGPWWRIARLDYAADAPTTKPILLSHSLPPGCGKTAAVSIAFEVSTSGTPEGVRIVKADDQTAAESALAYIRAMKFQPARQDGNAAPASAEVDLVCDASPARYPSELALVGDPLANQLDRRVVIGSAAMQARLVHQMPPVYPVLAKEARVQGVVRLSVIVDKDGKAKAPA